jgi:DNA primase
MIPIHDNNGYLAGFSGRVLKNVEPKYLNTGETKLFSKSNILFNYYKAKQFVDDKIIIVEGFMDAITYVRAGHKNVVATMGIALTDEHLTALHFFNKLNVVILSFDNDAAGVMATIANGQKLMENDFNVYVVAPYDKNIKDVDELSQRNGKEAIQNILDERIDFATFMINTEFASKKPLDEIQKSVNKIISQMINFGSNSLLLRQKHLKLLSEKSGLAFEDLKSKFEYDFTQINQLSQNQKIYSKYMPTKPDNDVGLPKTFIETEEIIKEKENNNIVSGKFYDALVEEQLALKKRLSQGYDKLILAIMNNSDKSFNFLKDLNIRQTDYEFIEQEYIFKSIDYMSIKGDKPDEKKLGEFLVEQSKGDNAIANNYKKAYAYLQRLIEKPIYLNFEKKLLSDKYEERLKIVNDIKAQKYELIMKSKTLEM